MTPAELPAHGVSAGLAGAAADEDDATYMVFGEAAVQDEDGRPRLVHAPIGTAWALGERLLATNSHVVEAFGVHVRHLHEMVALFEDNALQGFELPVEVEASAGQPGGGEQPATLDGTYAAAVTDPNAQHEFAFVVALDGTITGTSLWPQTGEFTLTGQAAPDGSFRMADDAPERVGFRRGTYEGVIAPDGTVTGEYFEETREQDRWPFTGMRVE